MIGTIQAGSGIAGDCVLEPLATDPLGVGQATIRSCEDPALWAEPVAPVQSVDPGYDGSLRVAHRVNGTIRLGPVLATYQENSGSHPVFAYGAGSLWIYEEQGPAGATLFRVSLATGSLIAATRTPDLTRPLLLANSDGAWLVPAGSFGAVSDVAIYHVALSSDRLIAALTLRNYTDGFAAWAAATTRGVDADLCSRPITGSSCELFGIAGSAATQVFHRKSSTSLDGADFAVAGPSGVYVIAGTNPSASSSTPYQWQVIHVDATTGEESVVASALLPEFWEGPDGTQQPDAVVIQGAILLLSNPDSTFPDRLEELSW